MKAKIIADSKDIFGNRITTILIVCDNETLKTLLTHKEFSITFTDINRMDTNNLIKSVKENPFIPIAWQKDHKGIQDIEYITTEDGMYVCNKGWLEAKDNAIKQALWMNSCGVTKKICNRLLEPFIQHTVLITATEWENFFELYAPEYYYDLEDKYFKSKKEWLKYYKLHCIGNEKSNFNLTDLQWLSINKNKSEIHIQTLVEAIWDNINKSIPRELQVGEWHTPYKNILDIQKRKNIIFCLSHFEHCAKAMTEKEYDLWTNGKLIEYEGLEIVLKNNNSNTEGWCNNFKGFISFKEYLKNKNGK